MTTPFPPDIADALRSASDRIRPIGERLTYRAVVSSTNDIAQDLAAAGAEDWTTVLAGEQTAGRGRQGRRWFSAPDAGLYFSTILRGVGSTPVTLMAGVAVTEGVREATHLPAEIKWPNDVVLPGSNLEEGRTTWKLAGILAETSRVHDTVDAVVVGIGINVSPACYPPELETVARSLATAVGEPVDRATVLVEVLAALTYWRGRLADGRVDEVLSRWRELAPTSVGSTVEWNEQGTRHRGVTQGIDGDGALLVRGDRGTTRLVAGEVTWVTRLGLPSPSRRNDAARD